MSLDQSDIYKDLDRGDGICVYFDEATKLCSIYNSRPLKCNVDETYNLFYKSRISLEEYYQQNYEACKKLKERRKK